MAAKVDDIKTGMEFISDGFDSEAYLDSETGEVHFTGDFVDVEPPDDLYDNEKYIEIPTKQDLDLGKHLTIRFAYSELPDHAEQVEQIFRSRGAYGRFKELLARNDALEKWYTYEDNKATEAIRDWCQLNDIEFE